MSDTHLPALARLYVSLDCAADIAEHDGNAPRHRAAVKAAAALRWIVQDRERLMAELADARDEIVRARDCGALIPRDVLDSTLGRIGSALLFERAAKSGVTPTT